MDLESFAWRTRNDRANEKMRVLIVFIAKLQERFFFQRAR